MSANVIPRRLPPLPTINDILRLYGVRAKKRLSQNFILDPKILNHFAKIVPNGGPKGKYIIEVGPGPGGITRALLDRKPEKLVFIRKKPAQKRKKWKAHYQK